MNLKGKDIHVVRQQDISGQAHPLDWFQSSPYGHTDKPRLHAGSLKYFSWVNADEIFPSYHIKSQERLALTGMFRSGDEENIVVFSEGYFEELKQSVLSEQAERPTPTQLVTMHSEKGDYQAISEDINAYIEKSSTASDESPSILSSYGKESLIPSITGERFFKEVAFAVTIFILLLSSLFIFYLKYSLETDEIRRRNQLLESVGMRNGERKRLFQGEVGMHSRWSFIGAAVISAIYCLIIPFNRLYTGKEILLYAISFLGLTALYLLLYFIGIRYLEKYFIEETR